MEDIRNTNKMITFKTSSHLYFEKGKSWFISVYLILLVLVALFVYLKQYLGAVVLAVAGVVLSIYSKIPPKEIFCIISKEGVKLDGQFYPYSSLKSFWIADIFPSPILYLDSAHRFRHLISVTLGDQPIEPIKRILREYLPEKSERGEDIRDKLIRIFRF